MVKGKGIFVNPASAAAPAKLRVLYEVGPIAYLIEKAGGKSSDGENSALDIQIPNTEVKSKVLSWHSRLYLGQSKCKSQESSQHYLQGYTKADGIHHIESRWCKSAHMYYISVYDPNLHMFLPRSLTFLAGALPGCVRICRRGGPFREAGWRQGDGNPRGGVREK